MKRLFIIINLLIALSVASASQTIHYVDLQHRPANEIIPLIKPMLEPGEAISGDGYQLFIKTSSQRKQILEDLIQNIDKTVKIFRITVSDDEFVSTENNDISASAKADVDNGEIILGRNPPDEPGITLHADTRKTEDRSDNTQFVLVQEGKPAFVTREKLHIYPVHAYVRRPNGDFIIEHYQPSLSRQDGFYIIARASGEDMVHIKIQSSTSKRQSYHGYGQEQTFIDTTVEIPLGSWFEIGGNTDTRETTSDGLIYRTHKNEKRQQRVFIKINLAD